MITVIFTATVLVGIITVLLAGYCIKYSNYLTQFSKLRLWALFLVSFGFAFHTFGDYMAQFYGEGIELTFESIAHVIIMIGFVILLYSSKKVLELAKEHGYK